MNTRAAQIAFVAAALCFAPPAAADLSTNVNLGFFATDGSTDGCNASGLTYAACNYSGQFTVPPNLIGGSTLESYGGSGWALSSYGHLIAYTSNYSDFPYSSFYQTASASFTDQVTIGGAGQGLIWYELIGGGASASNFLLTGYTMQQNSQVVAQQQGFAGSQIYPFDVFSSATAFTANVPFTLSLNATAETDGQYNTGGFGFIDVSVANIFVSDLNGTHVRQYSLNPSSGVLIAATPEPGAWVLLATGLSFLLFLFRTRFSAADKVRPPAAE